MIYMINRVGGGYHCDNLIGDYVNEYDKQYFSADEIADLQPKHDQMMHVLGEAACTIGLRVMKDIL